MGGIHIIKLLLGGSPCTHWSIAQTKNRETEPSGLGWELFLNYRIARDKYQPDYFLYENNKSMSPAIRAQITRELGVEPVLVNSALVSAQSRQRLYWVGKRSPDGTYSRVDVEQPEDRGILLRDILESGIAWQEKGYCLKAQYSHGIPDDDMLKRQQNNQVAEPAQVLNINPCGHGMNGAVIHINGKSRTLTTNKGEGPKIIEPVRIGTIESAAQNADFDSQQYRVYSPDGKSVTLCGNGGGVGAKTGLYAVPVAGRVVGRRINEQGHRDDYNENIPHFQYFEVNNNPQKTNCLTTVQKDNVVAVPIVYNLLHSCDVVITDQNIRCTYKDDSGTAQGYSVYFDDVKSPSVIAGHAHKMKVIERAAGKEHPIYEVRDGLITIKGKQYPIKLSDGYYIIRKLTVTECKRLQTVPESYVFPVSDTQAYKLLGNSWTVEVIKHILSYIPELLRSDVDVLSMYDGMSAGMIALSGMGANIQRYFSSEIDKYCIKTTQYNFPGIVQIGDAFSVRTDEWRGIVW